MYINKKLWFGFLMFTIFVVALSVASVNAEGDSDEVTSDTTTAVFMTDEESYEMFRQLGASEDVIKAMRELRSTFNELHARGASDEEAEAVIKEFNLRLQQLEEDDKGSKSSGNPQAMAG